MQKKTELVITLFTIGLLIALTITPSIMGDDTKDDRTIINLINEGFESGFPPTGWTNVGWLDSPYGTAHTGSHWAFSWAIADTLTTPTLQFEEDTELSFWYCKESGGAAKTLEVYIDGSTLVWSDTGFTHTSYQQAIVDLSMYTGDHTVDFIGQTEDFKGQLLDDILITTDADTEPPVINNVQANPDPQIPGGNVDITCDVSDNKIVDEVRVNITFPDTSTQSHIMTYAGGDYNYEQAYTMLGTYDYYIYATDASGNSDTSSTYNFNINNPPTADFSFLPVSPTTADVVSFTDLSTDSDGSIISWDWDFGDGATSTLENPGHSYGDDGVYTVFLTVTDDDGAMDDFSLPITVLNIGPVADFSFLPVSPTTADVVSFTDLSTDSDGSIISWDWDFGDGATSTLENPGHSYGDDGVYTVFLTVTDDDGAMDDFSLPITILNAVPVADFSFLPSNPTTIDTISFTDISTDSDGSIVSWYWDFGDGNTSTIANPTHSYSIPNNYFVTLTVTDDDGGIDDITKNIVVSGPEELDVDQSVFDRGFPIRHADDGDWAGAQDFDTDYSILARAEIYLRKFGTPEFDLNVEIRENAIDGPLIETFTFLPSEIGTSFTWLDLDFTDFAVTPGEQYFIVCPPAPSGVTTSFGYEWGYAFGNQYDDGSFWFTRDGGSLWRDLPSMYEFVFKTYAYGS